MSVYIYIVHVLLWICYVVININKKQFFELAKQGLIIPGCYVTALQLPYRYTKDSTLVSSFVPVINTNDYVIENGSKSYLVYMCFV